MADLATLCSVVFSFDSNNLATLAIPLRHPGAELAQIVLFQTARNIRADWRATMRRIIFAVFMLILLGTSVACNTVHGLGRDVERVGEETQDAANSVRRRL